jgi:hypothetical protein
MRRPAASFFHNLGESVIVISKNVQYFITLGERHDFISRKMNQATATDA